MKEDFQTVLKLKRYLLVCMPWICKGWKSGESVIQERESRPEILVCWSGLEDGSECRSTCKARPLQGQLQLGVMRVEVI